jgi:hypothetical protein
MQESRRRAWDRLNKSIEQCAACERLVAHCRRVAGEKKAAYREWAYWVRASELRVRKDLGEGH